MNKLSTNSNKIRQHFFASFVLLILLLIYEFFSHDVSCGSGGLGIAMCSLLPVLLKLLVITISGILIITESVGFIFLKRKDYKFFLIVNMIVLVSALSIKIYMFWDTMTSGL